MRLTLPVKGQIIAFAMSASLGIGLPASVAATPVDTFSLNRSFGPALVTVETTQMYPLHNEKFTLTVNSDELAALRAQHSDDLTYEWSHAASCAPGDLHGETLTASCSNPENRFFSKLHNFDLQIRSGAEVVATGSGYAYVTRPYAAISATVTKFPVISGMYNPRAGDLSGKGPVGTPIELQLRTIGSTEWKTMQTVSTDADGRFSWTSDGHWRGAVRAHFAGNEAAAPVMSQASPVMIATKVKVRVDGNVLYALVKDIWGDTLNGRDLSVVHDHRRLEQPGAMGRTDKNGRAKLTVRGRFTKDMYVSHPGGNGYGGSGSRTFRLN